MTRIETQLAKAVNGFSNEKLEDLSVWNTLERGLSPWATWESENSSFGRTFRKWLWYPSFLPLFFGSDHAVHWESKCWPNEVNNSQSLFFTWNERKNTKMNKFKHKNSFHVPHPWINYRKRSHKNPPQQQNGTLVFFPHSNNSGTPEILNITEYFKTLLNLPKKFQPVVLCLSFHDINKGLHKELRKYGIPIVTAGSTNSQYFVDRFYTLIKQFVCTTSPNIGSHTFYAMEAGIPFFLLGKEPSYIIHNSDSIDNGLAKLTDYGDRHDIENLNYLKSICRKPSLVVTDEQKKIINGYLGLNSVNSRLKVTLFVWLSFFKSLHKLAILYFIFGSSIFRKVIRYVKHN